MNNMLPRICRECNTAFLGGPRAWYCPSCRIHRRKEGDARLRNKKKMGTHIPLGSTIKCELCGCKIEKTGGSKRFCEQCAKAHLKAVDNAQSLDWKARNPEKAKEANRSLTKRRCAEDGKQSHIKYITWDKAKRKWRVCPYVNGSQIRIGCFSDLEEAAEKLNEFMQLNVYKK